MPLAFKFILILIVSLLLGYFNSIRSNTPFLTPPENNLFEEMKLKLPKGVKALTLKETHEIYIKNSRIFVDARLPEHFKKDHIEGAENLPIYKIEENLPLFLDKYSFDTPLLIYCGSLHCDSSTRLADKLKEIGFADIKVFLGGWAEWRKQILKR